MAGITLAQAEAQLAVWLEASIKIAGGQSYRIGDRQLQRADLDQVNRQIQFWQKQVERLGGDSAAGIRVGVATL